MLTNTRVQLASGSAQKNSFQTLLESTIAGEWEHGHYVHVLYKKAMRYDPAKAADLGMLGVRGAVCAQEEARVAAGCCRGDRPPVLLPLQDWQAERVRPQPTLVADAILVAADSGLG